MVIDELVAVLGFDLKGKGDLDQFNRGLKQAEGNAKTFVMGLTKLAAAATAAFAAIGGAAAIGNGISNFVSGITQTGREFENFGVRLRALEGSSEAAEKAMAWIKQFAIETPLELAEVVESFAQMRSFGMDPTNGSLRAIVDAMAATGGGAEKLNGIVLALGQAWTKGKLQGEEAMQLLERGVPVWQLLGEATGKNAEQLMELSSKGKLGRKEIQLLIDMLGKKYLGASAQAAKTFDGILSNLTDNWSNWLLAISDAGYYDNVKRRLQGLLEYVNGLWTSGFADRMAGNVSRTLVWTMDVATHLATQAFRIGRGFYFAADGVAGLVGEMTGLSKGMAAAGLGVGLVASSAFGRKALLSVAGRLPMVAALLMADDLLSALNGDNSMIGSTEAGAAAIDRLKTSLTELETAGANVKATFADFGANMAKAFGLPEDTFADGRPYGESGAENWRKSAKSFGASEGTQDAMGAAGGYIGSTIDTYIERLRLLFTDPMKLAETRLTDLIDNGNTVVTAINQIADAISMSFKRLNEVLFGKIEAGPALPPTLTVGGGAGPAILRGNTLTPDAGLVRDGMQQAEGLKQEYGVDTQSLIDASTWAAKAISSVQAFLEPAAAAKSALMDLERTVQARADLDINPILQKVQQAKDAIRSLQSVGMIGGGQSIAPTRTFPNAVGGT